MGEGRGGGQKEIWGGGGTSLYVNKGPVERLLPNQHLHGHANYLNCVRIHLHAWICASKEQLGLKNENVHLKLLNIDNIIQLQIYF